MMYSSFIIEENNNHFGFTAHLELFKARKGICIALLSFRVSVVLSMREMNRHGIKDRRGTESMILWE